IQEFIAVHAVAVRPSEGKLGSDHVRQEVRFGSRLGVPKLNVQTPQFIPVLLHFLTSRKRPQNITSTLPLRQTAARSISFHGPAPCAVPTRKPEMRQSNGRIDRRA